MDVDPPKRWQRVKIDFICKLPLEPRTKIKRLLKMGDEYLRQEEKNLAKYCYILSKELAKEAGIIHLLKKVEERMI